MPLLVLRFLSPAEASEDGFSVDCEWLILDNGTDVRGHGFTDYQGLAELADPNQEWVTNPANVLMIVPNQYVLEVSATVPGRNPSQIRRALPFAVEEFIASDIESMHLASGTIKAGQPVSCQLVEQRLLENWLACLRSVGVQPGFCVADAHLLPHQAGEGTEEGAVLFDGDQVIVRTQGQAATIDRANLILALQTLTIDRLSLINGDLSDIERAQLDEFELERVQRGNSTVEALASYWSGRTDINILQGAFSPPKSRSINRGWAVAAALAGAWIAIAWGAMLAEAWWADHQAAELDQEARTLYGQLFPGEKPRNVRRSMAAKLGGTSAVDGRGFVALTADVASILPKSAGMKALDYASDKDELKTEIFVASFTELERFEQQLASRGVEAQLQNSLQEGDGVRAYFVVREQQ